MKVRILRRPAREGWQVPWPTYRQCNKTRGARTENCAAWGDNPQTLLIHQVTFWIAHEVAGNVASQIGLSASVKKIRARSSAATLCDPKQHNVLLQL